ncbi:MAG: hypothetical protein IPN53_25035 [Comamonadaceae bacterium]|nr:hypothetical protein [Comamonadaceae bacterium]
MLLRSRCDQHVQGAADDALGLELTPQNAGRLARVQAGWRSSVAAPGVASPTSSSGA